MDTLLLHLHSILRWIVLGLLIYTLVGAFTKNAAIKKSSLWLMITAHTMLLIGIYQWVAGRMGILNVPENINIMKDSYYRFFLVEHPMMMIISIILISIGRGKAKELNFKATTWLLLVALILILAAVPWPIRVAPIGRPWFPGLG